MLTCAELFSTSALKSVLFPTFGSPAQALIPSLDQKVLMTYLPCPFSTPSRHAERRGLSVEILSANLVSTSGGCALC